MIGKSLYLTILNIIGRVINFLLFFAIANKFGASGGTDWFFFLFAIIYYLATIFARSTESVLVPQLNKDGLVNVPSLLPILTVTNLVGVIFTTILICLVGLIAAPHFFSIVPPDNTIVSVIICCCLSLQPWLANHSAFYSSYLQAEQKYTLPTIQLTIRSLGILPFLLFPWCTSILCLSLAFLTGEISRLAVLWKKTKLQFLQLPKNIWKTIADNSPLLKQIGWLTVALGSSQLNPVVDMAMVGSLGEGCATLVSYVEKFRGLPILALNGLLVLLLGEWSRQHQRESKSLAFSQVAKMALVVFLIVTLALAPMVLFIQYLFPMIFFSHHFSDNDVARMINLFISYSPGIPMLAGYFVVSYAFLVYQNTKFLALLAALNALCNIPLNYFLIKWFGIIGVAMSTSFLDAFIFFASLFFFWIQSKK